MGVSISAMSQSKNLNPIKILPVAAILLATVSNLTAAGHPAGGQSSIAKSLDNLKAAYAGETEASAKYLVYAKVAAKEHMPYEAGLFTAIARSESIHARNHKRVLVAHGVRVTPTKFAGKIGTTAENVSDSLVDETHEYTVMYPDYIAQAATEGAQDASRSFGYALQAEMGHAGFFALAEKSEKAGKTLEKAHMFVCAECGQTFETNAPATCPVCDHALNKASAVK